jgi:glycosyltransferase involved in cell wall biosynthesis
MALRDDFLRRGLSVINNKITKKTRGCLFNSFNFNTQLLRKLKRDNCRMVHRIDGPLSIYRGKEEGIDREIWKINQELADYTIFQSNYSLQKHLELNLEFKNVNVIMNAVDPIIFYSKGQINFNCGRKIRLISTSWSDNPNKGMETYAYLERHLDWSKYEYTFVGRIAISFKNIKLIPPVHSTKLADILRDHDIYIAASRNDPCSNALIEALACGLPALYLNSGGHPEIVRQGGLFFNFPNEVPELLNKMIFEFTKRQSLISLPTISEIADRYLSVLGMKT